MPFWPQSQIWACFSVDRTGFSIAVSGVSDPFKFESGVGGKIAGKGRNEVLAIL